MMDQLFLLIKDTALLNNLLLMLFFSVFTWVFYKESKNPNSHINWTDLVSDTKTQRVSLNKLGQFWGIAISSWIVIFMAQTPSTYAIFPIVFPAWLAFVGGSYAFNTFLKNKKEEQK